MTLGRNKIKRWLYTHPRLYGIYKQRKYRIATAWMRRLPDFLIIGAQKSGTTTLYDWVTSHPRIGAASLKEINYFSRFWGSGNMWYRSHFPITWSQHDALTGEASPSYLLYEASARRAITVLPAVKLIAILRNPVDRAYSSYHYSVRRGGESLSFEEALRIEDKRAATALDKVSRYENIIPYDVRSQEYLARGRYAEQLERWFTYYNQDRFLILDATDLRRDPQKTLDLVFDFLGVEKFRLEMPRNLNVGRYDPMKSDIRRYLVEYYKPHNQKLYTLLGRSFDWDQ